MNDYQIFLSILKEFLSFETLLETTTVDTAKLKQAIKLVWKDEMPISKWEGQSRLLQSILQKLKSENLKYEGLPHFIKPQELIFNSDSFFTLEKEQPVNELYQKHYNDFRLALTNAESFENIFVITQKYGTSIGFTEGVCDVSLFDFVKLTCAAYICLQKSDKVIMIGGDLSGIQEFIYEIVPKTAVKSLKGRSAYIQLLLESAVFRLLKELSLTEINVISSTGGKYFILAPDTPKNKETVKGLSIEFNDQMFEKHGSLISMQLTFVPITSSENNEWVELKKQLTKLKDQQFKTKLIDKFEIFFSPKEKGGERRRDVVTNEEFTDKEEEEFKEKRKKGKWSLIGYLEYEDDGTPIDTDNNKTAVKKSTYDMVRLGRRLIDAEYWLTTNDKDILNKKYFETAIKGVYHYFIKKDDYQLFKGYPIRQLNSTKGNTAWMLYGGNEFPVYSENEIDKKTDKIKNRKGDIKDFSALAKAPDEKLQRLAVLRMDVDGLGQKFENGIPDKNLVRELTLSRTLEYFIKGFLNHIWKNISETSPKHSYILYSGGDDLFLLGRWREIVDLADKIQTDFQEWVGNNPACTLSGGISIVLPKFPVLHSARLAGEAQDISKNYEKDGVEKNAITLFDIPMNWEKEFSTVKVVKAKLVEYTQGERPHINKSILGKINMYYDMKTFQERDNKNPKWLWTALYDLTRFHSNNSITNLEAKQFVINLKENIVVLKNNYITLAAVSARWAELSMRTDENQ